MKFITMNDIAKAVFTAQKRRRAEGLASDFQSAALDVELIDVATRQRMGRGPTGDDDEEFYRRKQELIQSCHRHKVVTRILSRSRHGYA